MTDDALIRAVLVEKDVVESGKLFVKGWLAHQRLQVLQISAAPDESDIPSSMDVNLP